MSTSKTVYPGMPAVAAAAPGTNQSKPMTQCPGLAAPSNPNQPAAKQLMGFLYSVSKTAAGEFWPVYVGPNTIGRGADNSICLNEASVSEKHATLVVRKLMKNGASNGVSVFISDTLSTYGTMLNGETLDSHPRDCNNGDIITFGSNYEMYFVLVDPDALGLAPKDSFMESNPTPAPAPAPVVNPGWTQQPVGMNTGDAHKGTLPGTGSSPFDGRKPTMYMPGNNK